MTTIPANALTLSPVNPTTDDGLPPFDSDRRILTFAGPAPVLTDEWRRATLEDGRTVVVRRADCGLGCRCAGEYRVLAPEAEQDTRRCNWCGANIAEDTPGVWLDAMSDGHCDNNEDGHEPEPTDRDFWQDGPPGTSYLDTTITPKDSPVSMTLRAVLGPDLVNSNGDPVTYEVAYYRTYHAAGTNVPDLGPWHPTLEPRSGWTTEEAAMTWAEKGDVADEWDFDNDALYKAQVELVTAVKQAQAARDDRLVVDQIAALLGTSPDWNADHTTRIADLIGAVRPHPGGYEDPDDYRAVFLAATGHQPPEVRTY